MTSPDIARRAFAVITDSTSDMPLELAAERGIEVVPLSASFGEETFVDGELTQAEFFRRMDAAPELPTTSQPSVGAFVEAYERVLKTADAVISVHISEKLSGTIDSARQAAEQFPGRVHIFDSRNLSWGLAYQALDAAASAAEGLSVAAALERLEDVRGRVRMLVGVDSLKSLQKGGRIGKVSGFLGSMLDLKVTFTVDENGEFLPLKRSRGDKAAMRYTMEWVAEQMGDARRARFAVQHAMSLDRAEQLRVDIEGKYEAEEMHVVEVGIVIATHVGTGWGVTLVPAR
jgi:DegV family protein with EDD domain